MITTWSNSEINAQKLWIYLKNNHISRAFEFCTLFPPEAGLWTWDIRNYIAAIIALNFALLLQPAKYRNQLASSSATLLPDLMFDLAWRKWAGIWIWNTALLYYSKKHTKYFHFERAKVFCFHFFFKTILQFTNQLSWNLTWPWRNNAVLWSWGIYSASST